MVSLIDHNGILTALNAQRFQALHSIYNIKNYPILALKSYWVADITALSFCV